MDWLSIQGMCCFHYFHGYLVKHLVAVRAMSFRRIHPWSFCVRGDNIGRTGLNERQRWSIHRVLVISRPGTRLVSVCGTTGCIVEK